MRSWPSNAGAANQGGGLSLYALLRELQRLLA
jgi:hypothetical protein